MLWTTAVILFVLWAMGLVTDYTGAGLIHILPMLAIALVLVRLIEVRGPRSTKEAKSSSERAPQLQEKV